ncbi:phosphatidylinositol N-acetylglucosaminyltransferase subunit Q isoform X1 [Neodiprion virginianus]|uniref:phosphatidylinositol N-acetylglucosaminyltransferase subunit Q isoform X1 n=1 Tax=Neodiprion virginianus TaxID=2961670 RepID=UPI001EE6DB11|nr:phosphatidylinositol N-acetylglucosaminyltransferase subunit Q isoform X1 [Neodiprion virginianus]
MTKTILVFIPKEFCNEKPGYTFGRVVYDSWNESKKFFIIGVRKVDSGNTVKSNSDLIGYFSGSKNTYGYLDKTLSDWINIYLSPNSKSNSVNCEYCIRDVLIDNRKITPTAYHTVIIIYDQTALLQAELLVNKAPSGDHFQELKQTLQKRSIKDEINRKSKFSLIGEILLTYHALFFLYQMRFLYKIASKLLPILKYSALGLHMHSWLENGQWTLTMIVQRKRITLKTANYILATALDVLLGVLLLRFLLENIGHVPPSRVLLNNAERVVESLKGLVNWLMGAPAGLKLNHSFNGMLGRFFLYHINLWWAFLVFSEPLLEFAFKVLILCGRLGVTFQIAIIADLLALVSFHSYCIYVYAARMFNMQLRGLMALFHLFLGKKKNPLRERVDSCQYQADQLFVGTLLFTILLFLMPTTWVYYSVFTILRLVLIGLGGFLTRLKFYLQVLPVYAFVKWLIRSPVMSIPGTINMKIYPRSGEGPTTLIVSTVVSPWGETWKRCILETINPHLPVEWGKIVRNVFRGQLLYPL